MLGKILCITGFFDAIGGFIGSAESISGVSESIKANQPLSQEEFEKHKAYVETFKRQPLKKDSQKKRSV